MFIKLGDTNIIYNTKKSDDFIICAQVLNSRLSYEVPTYVRSVKELDLWFGKDYSDYSYLKELLENNITLFLYKPISNKKNIEIDSKYDISSYSEEENIYYIETDVSINEKLSNYCLKNLPKIGTDFLIYKVVDRSVGINNYNRYIWIENQYAKADDVFNSNINTSSTNNRDTLFLNRNNIYYTSSFLKENKLDFNYYYIYKNKKIIPTYVKSDSSCRFIKNSIKDINIELLQDNDLIKLNIPYILDIDSKMLSDINKGKYTLAWKINWKSVENSYIVFQDFEDNYHLLYSTSNTELINKLSKLLNNCKTHKFTSDKDLEKILTELGYLIKGDIIYSLKPMYVSYMQDNIEISPILSETQSFLRESFEEEIDIKFWSKTIGQSIDSEKIGVKFEKIDSINYRVIISRLGYSEIFEGNFLNSTKTERLDYTISKNSKLVYCDLINDLTNVNLPIDSWTLSGSTEESYDKYSFENSLKYFRFLEIPIDFILVPDKSKLSDELLLEKSKEVNCQVLIQNNYDFDTNITNITSNIIDKDNRLIYFLNSINYNYSTKPGYYIYLKGLLSGKFSETADDIIYKSPKNLDLIKQLEKYKSNYLIDTGQYYFYKKYFDGDDYITSGWMRFAISKISREIEKNKSVLIGTKIDSSGIKGRFIKLFSKLVDKFSIIYSIDIEDFVVDYNNSKINITITTKIDDLVKNDLTLDLIINYKTN